MPINEQDRTRVPADIMFLQINAGEVERCCAIGNLTAEPINSISDEPLPPTRAFMSFDSESVTVELSRKNPPRSVTGTGATYKEAFAAAQAEARGRWLDDPQPWNWPPLTDNQINEIFEP